MKIAHQGIQQLRNHTDTLIVIPNDRLLQIAPPNLSFEMSFRLADDILRQSIQGITNLIAMPKFINVDFSNVRSLMKLGGGALMCTGQAGGENRLLKAVHQAITHPLLADACLANAAGILVNFTSGEDLPIIEIGEAMDYLHRHLGAPPETVFGVAYDERLRNRVEVILIATGLGAVSLEDALPGFKSAAQAPAPEQAKSTEAPAPRNLEAQLADLFPTLDMSDLDTPAYLRRG
jgi:cell division protein FtsZ